MHRSITGTIKVPENHIQLPRNPPFCCEFRSKKTPSEVPFRGVLPAAFYKSSNSSNRRERYDNRSSSRRTNDTSGTSSNNQCA